MISVIVPVYNVEDYLHYAMRVWKWHDAGSPPD